MKIAGRKIPKGSFLLAASFAAISACLLLVLSSARIGRADALSRNGLYSGRQRSFGISNAEGDRQWEEAIPALKDKFDNFALYLPVKGTDIVSKGIFVDGEIEAPPLLWGRYFDSQTSWTEHPTAVLGKDYQKETIQRGGKLYYTYRDVEYEVIGIMGTAEKSRLNQMLVMDFRSAVQMTGVNTSYVLDAENEPDIIAIGQELQQLFVPLAEVGMFLGEREKGSMLDGIFSSDKMMHTVYTMALASFFLCTILVTAIWLRFRRSLFFAWELCGFQKLWQYLETAKYYFQAAGAGFLAGLMLAVIFCQLLSDIHIAATDILLSLAMAMCLGWMILTVSKFTGKIP